MTSNNALATMCFTFLWPRTLLLLGVYFLPVDTAAEGPWLTKESANVLKLTCLVPFGKFMREGCSLASLGLQFQPAKSLNRSSLLHVSKGGKPQRGSKLPTAAEYEYFVDSSDPKNPRQPFLSIMMPIGKDLGLYGSYFCQIISTSCSSPELVYEITVNKTFVENSEETSKNSFSAKSVKSDKVTATWSVPESGESDIIRFYRWTIGLDQDGNVTKSSHLLVGTKKDKIDDKASNILLAQVEASSTQDRSNYTAHFYTDTEVCHPYCWYTCKIMHASCSEEDAGGCKCQGPAVPPSINESKHGANTTSEVPVTSKCEKDCLTEGLVPGLLLPIAFFLLHVLHKTGIICGKKVAKTLFCCPQSITELVDDVLEKAERRRQGLERAAEENADNDAEREYRDFDIRRMPEAGEGEGVPEAGEEVDHVVGQNRGEPNQEREAVPLMEAGRPNGGEEQEPTGEDRLNPRDVREIRERIRNNPDKNFLQNLGTQNENVKNVVADERKRLVCRSDDVVILFNSTGELIHWFFIQKDKMEPEEQKLLSKLRWCRRAKENNDAATETLRQFMRHVRDALDADVRE